MTAPPKRRWFRFSLRTMFVVVTLLAIPLGWLVWQMQIVRERRQLLEWIELRGGTVNRLMRDNIDSLLAERARRYSLNPRLPKVSSFGRRNTSTDIPWFRRTWLGDRAVDVISLPRAWDADPEAKRLDVAFPEAYLIFAPG